MGSRRVYILMNTVDQADENTNKRRKKMLLRLTKAERQVAGYEK